MSWPPSYMEEFKLRDLESEAMWTVGTVKVEAGQFRESCELKTERS